MADKNAYLITTPIYYANAKPHIGHMYTSVISDILARHERLLGKNVLFSTGMDEHGANIARKAHAAQKTPKRFVDEQARFFHDAWQTLGISYDDFIRTTQTRHEEAVEVFLRHLKSSGTVYKDTYEGLYCGGCEAFKDPSDLLDGKCPLHLSKPEPVTENNWFFKLSQFRDELVKRVTNDEIRIVPETRKREVLSFLARGISDISISRENQSWGVPVPFDPTQTTYVWVDALINYLTVAGYPYDKNRLATFWPAAWHIIGKDIIRFHCVIWPALLLAVGIEPPKGIFVHGFLTVNGQKMSKTLGNVITPYDLLDRFGPDGARYALVRQMTPGDDSDVALEKLTDIYNAELKNGVGNLFARSLTLALRANLQSLSPLPHAEAERVVAESWQEYDSALAAFHFSNALEATQKLVTWANRFVDRTKPWQVKDETRLAKILYPILEVTRHIAWQLAPFTPRAASAMAAHLGIKMPSTLLTNQLAGLKQWSTTPLQLSAESIHLFS